MKRFRQLWHDERGAIVSIEVVVIATVLVIAATAAWVAVRNAVIVQINDQAGWISGEEEEMMESTALDEIVTCSDMVGPGEGS